ncbi:hypothetical protein [Halobacteriovorax sp. HLS]|uniref:hypothetical protein n=1 Tax=Halobacteriovorax sp. HLS TaxID=2234000 RepID=UPI000FDBEBEB|nr:hypothetical protein [Halobacteriovorax sp. HLS]
MKKKRDKKNYIIALLSIYCCVLTFFLFNQNKELKQTNAENKSLAKDNSALSSKNAALSSGNTLKGIKISSLQGQLDALTKEIRDANSSQNIEKRVQNNIKSIKSEQASQKQISELKKSMAAASAQSAKTIKELSKELKETREVLSSTQMKLSAKALSSTPSYKSSTRKTYKKYIPKMKSYNPYKTVYSYKRTRTPASYRSIERPKKVTQKKKEADKLLGDLYEE